jgi:hypothetical protein
LRIIIHRAADGIGVKYGHDVGIATGEVNGRTRRYIMNTTFGQAKVVFRVEDAKLHWIIGLTDFRIIGTSEYLNI